METLTRYYFTSISTAMIKGMDNKHYQDMEKLEPLYSAGGNVKCAATFEEFGKSYDPAIPLCIGFLGLLQQITIAWVT